MSWGYPDGCTQADHDRAFGELGPSPGELAAEADAQNDFERDYPDCPFCEGSGDMLISAGLPGDYIPEYVPCSQCRGSGKKNANQLR